MADREPDQIAPPLEQQRVSEGQTVDDLDLLRQIHAAADRVGDPVDAREGGLLLRLLERGEAAHRRRRLGGLRRRRRPGRPAVDRAAHDRAQVLRTVSELVVEVQVLGARRVRDAAVQRRLVLVEELLRGADELLADRLVVIVRQDRDRAQHADGTPRHRKGHPHDLGVVFLGDEAAPRLHEPAVVNILRAAERLARPGAELTLEEVAEGLLHHVADLREVALPHPTDLDLGQPALGLEPRAIDRGSHFVRPARSSSRVITPE